jgi:hypothetical protein
MAKKKPPKLRKSESEAEFKLLVERFSDELTHRSGVAFIFRTSEQFQNFVYELVVEASRTDQRLFFNILGLKTPMSDFPRPGPAVCRLELEDLQQGDYTIIVDRRGKRVNQFKLSLKKVPKVMSSPRNDRFIDVLTERSEWAFIGE